MLSRVPKSTKVYKETRNYQAQQESLLIMLLNKYATISLSIPSVESNELNFFRIKSITFEEGNTIDVCTFLNKRCTAIYEQDIQRGTDIKTAKRRKQTNRRIEVLNLMADLLTFQGYFFDTKESTGKRDKKKMSNIVNVFKDSEFLMNIETIKMVGSCIDAEIMNLCKESSEIVLLPGTLSFKQ